jgi:ABC-type hemin transport system ATPase subunit
MIACTNISRRGDEVANVIILLGETGAEKSLLLEYLTGTIGHSGEAATSGMEAFPSLSILKCLC